MQICQCWHACRAALASRKSLLDSKSVLLAGFLSANCQLVLGRLQGRARKQEVLVEQQKCFSGRLLECKLSMLACLRGRARKGSLSMSLLEVCSARSECL